MKSEHPFFDELRQAIEGLQPMNEAYNPEFQTEMRPNWTSTPNPQQRRLHDLFVGIPPVSTPVDRTVDVQHQVVQELTGVPAEAPGTLHVLLAAYDDKSAPPEVVGIYEQQEKAKAMFDLLEKYRDENITFYLVSKVVE